MSEIRLVYAPESFDLFGYGLDAGIAKGVAVHMDLVFNLLCSGRVHEGDGRLLIIGHGGANVGDHDGLGIAT